MPWQPTRLSGGSSVKVAMDEAGREELWALGPQGAAANGFEYSACRICLYYLPQQIAGKALAVCGLLMPNRRSGF